VLLWRVVGSISRNTGLLVPAIVWPWHAVRQAVMTHVVRRVLNGYRHEEPSELVSTARRVAEQLVSGASRQAPGRTCTYWRTIMVMLICGEAYDSRA
jgi:hypothetical protein